MSSLKCPYEKSFSPFKVASKYNAPWLHDIVIECATLAKQMSEELEQEARFCSDTSLLNHDEMYRRFKENCKTGQHFGNWIILKYFSRMMKIDLLMEVTGKWGYTKETKEMYEYFVNFNTNSSTKCKQYMLKYKSCIETDCDLFFTNTVQTNRNIYIEFESDNLGANNVLCVPYLDFFRERYFSILNMERVAKMQNKLTQDYKFFDKNCFFIPTIRNQIQTVGKIKSFNIERILNLWEKEAQKPKEIDPSEFYMAAEKYAQNNPQYLKLTSEREILYMKLLNNFIKTGEGKAMFARLPKECAEQIKKEGI